MTFQHKIRMLLKKYHESALSILIVLFYFLICYLLLASPENTNRSESNAVLPLHPLAKKLFETGIFLFSITSVALLVGRRPKSYVRPVLGVLCFSIAISILLVTDKINAEKSAHSPETFSEVFYVLINERHTLLILIVLTLAVIVLVTYYLIKTFLKVTYSGSGLQIKIPAQTMYYLPVYPKITWQNIGIEVQEGDRIDIELSGYVTALPVVTFQSRLYNSAPCKLIRTR